VTTIFSILLPNNVYILVGDKLFTNYNNSVYPEYINKKIFIINNKYLIGYSGSPILFEKFMKYLSESDLLDIKTMSKLFMQKSDLSVSMSNDKIDLELIIIDTDKDKDNKYIININDLKENSELDDFISLESIIGSGRASEGAKYVISSVPFFNNNRTEKLIIQECVSILHNISLADPKLTGSPYIYGCNIIIYKNSNFNEYDIISNGCKYKKNISKWKNL